ncbi:MAG: MarR family transcriptional regulator [Chloroflexota bacterium]|nr:MarR family transcriptional regulator [Chloroflexota bacterium]
MTIESNDLTSKMAVWRGYLQTHATLVRLLEAALQKEQGLALIWYDALHHLNGASQWGLRLQELADAINLSQSGLTRLLDRMTEEGLVERRPCSEDRRGLYAVITPMGRTQLAQATPVYQQVLDEHFLHYLSCEEVHALLRVFTNIEESHSDHK